jgi:hypothetical protein
VLLDARSRPGSMRARVVLPRAGLSLPLPLPLGVLQPPLLSVTDRRLNVSADTRPFVVGVRLSQPAPPGGVSVALQPSDASAAQVALRVRGVYTA